MTGPETATATADRLPGAGSDDWRERLARWSRPPQSPTKIVESFSGAPAGRRLFISSGYGWRSDPFGRGERRHDGIDLPGRLGSRVYATGSGVVTIAGWINGYGNLVQIDHPGGLRTRYGHLSRILVSRGSAVSQGEVVGLMGSTGRSTGSHLHYEVRVAGDPVNPLAFMGASTVPRYAVAWQAPRQATSRWTGWAAQDLSLLPEATIR